MSATSSNIAEVFNVISKGKEAKVGHLFTEDATFNGREVTIENKRLINFASCSYLGLALDERLKNGAKEGTERYGTSFPTSRAFLSMGYLESLEQELEKLFGYPCILTSSTSLGHIAYMPLIISKEDVIIHDHQVHNSVSVGSLVPQSFGCKRDVVRHGNLEKLEEKLILYSKSARKVWYLADGIYSMYGDKAPIESLNQLLDKYEKFHVYVDDAHGMSWIGERGKGYVLDQGSLHPKMSLITSLGKSFGSLGGALIFNNQKTKEFVKTCAGPLIFSSPVVPAIIGASLASAQIHMSSELNQLQAALNERISFFRKTALSLDLPILGKGDTPIFFIPAGNPQICFDICSKMMTKGYYQSPSIYPSVPINNGGLRYTVTNWIHLEDIENMLNDLAKVRSRVLKKHTLSNKKLLARYKGIEVS